MISAAGPDRTLQRLLTAAEVSRMLGICEKTLGNHVAAGCLPFISIGRGASRQRRMFHPADVQAFIDERRVWMAPAEVGKERGLVRGSENKVIDFARLREERRAAKRARSGRRDAARRND